MTAQDIIDLLGSVTAFILDTLGMGDLKTIEQAVQKLADDVAYSIAKKQTAVQTVDSVVDALEAEKFK